MVARSEPEPRDVGNFFYQAGTAELVQYHNVYGGNRSANYNTLSESYPEEGMSCVRRERRNSNVYTIEIAGTHGREGKGRIKQYIFKKLTYAYDDLNHKTHRINAVNSVGSVSTLRNEK